MSDNINEVHAIWDKIEALEKKYKELDRLSMGRRDDLFNRQSDLAKLVKEQIAELRERMKTMEKFYSTLYDQVDNNRIRTNELKEDIKGYKLSVGNNTSNLGAWVLKWGITQEILQKLMESEKRVHNIGDCDYTFNDHVKEINKLLKKLDSKSGGEKEDRWAATVSNQKAVSGGSALPENSKLPEPIKACFNCYYFLDSNACNNRHSYSYKEFIYTTFATGICNNYRPEPKPSMACGDGPEPKIPSDFKGTWKEDLMYMVEANKTEPELIEEFLEKLRKIQNPWGLVDYDDTWRKIYKEYEGMIK